MTLYALGEETLTIKVCPPETNKLIKDKLNLLHHILPLSNVLPYDVLVLQEYLGIR